MKHLFPEEDETKGTLEIFAESVGQIVFIVSMLWFGDRIIRYVPTYSKLNIPNTPRHIHTAVLHPYNPPDKTGGKIEWWDRLMDTWHGRNRTTPPPPKKQGGQVPVQHQPSQADHLDTSQILPQNRQLTRCSNPERNGPTRFQRHVPRNDDAAQILSFHQESLLRQMTAVLVHLADGNIYGTKP